MFTEYKFTDSWLQHAQSKAYVFQLGQAHKQQQQQQQLWVELLSYPTSLLNWSYQKGTMI